MLIQIRNVVFVDFIAAVDESSDGKDEEDNGFMAMNIITIDTEGFDVDYE